MEIRNLIAGAMAAVCACSTFAAGPWASDLWLSRGGEWTKRAEVCVSNATTRAWKAETVPVRVGEGGLPIGGVGFAELRVVDGEGVQLEFGAYGTDGNSVADGGRMADGGFLALPVTASPGGVARFCVYWGNPRAWALADRWRKKPKGGAGAVVSVGGAESLSLAVRGEGAPWPKSGGWEYRVPVRFRNLSDRSLESATGQFVAPEAFHATRNPEFLLEFEGRKVPCVRVGDRMFSFFFLDVPAKSVCVAYLYVKTGRAQASAGGARENAQASEIPSDQVSLAADTALDGQTIQAFSRFLGGGASNLVENAGFSQGHSGWSFGRGRKGVKVETRPCGLFGGSCSVLTVTGEAAKGSWEGVTQVVDVEPGRDYAYGAFIKGRDVSAWSTVHIHLLDADGLDPVGKDGKRRMLALCARTGRTGTFGWTPVFGKVRVPDNVRKLSIHLTMNGTGELYHDGALVVACGDTALCDPESAPRAPGDFAVCQTSPIVKVFPEFCVRNADGPFSLALARNETEDLQLAVACGSAADIAFEVEPPADGKGGALRVEPGVVTYVPVDFPSAYYSRTTDEEYLRTPNHDAGCDGWSGMWPDPVERMSSFRLSANSAMAVRLAISADGSAAPGTYTGAIRWKVDGKAVRRDVFRVKVWDFVIPKRPAFAAIYDVRLGSGMWRAQGGKGAGDVRRRVLDTMAAYKICPDKVFADPVFRRAADGTVTADFTAYDKAASEHFDDYRFPAAYMPLAFYCFGWGHPPKDFLGEKPYEGSWPFTGADRSKLRPEYVKAYQSALRLYWDHVKAKGWADRLVLYISDEPYFNEARIREQMIALCRMIHEVDPKIRIYCSTWRHCPEWDASLDVWGVGSYGCFPTNEMTRLSAEGKGIWFTTDGQQCLDTPWCAIERMQPMYSWAYGAEAYEFWGCTWLTYDPWRYGWHSFIRQAGSPEKGESWVRYPNGDGYHIYPPRSGSPDMSPVPSVRLCAIRDGVEEHSYLERLSAISVDGALPAQMRADAGRILDCYRALLGIPNAGGRYSTSILPEPEELDRLRQRAGNLIERASAGGRP